MTNQDQIPAKRINSAVIFSVIKQIRSIKRQNILVLGVFFFLAIIVLEQWLSYQQLTNHIGKHAYADTYALRMIGKPGDYLGVIEGVRWNALPTSKEDVQGWQPRYLIARETIKGSTEKRWYCTYLIKPDDTPPEKYKPRPFPAYRNLREK